MNINYDNFQTLSKDKIEFVQRIVNDDKLVKCLISNAPNFLEAEITDLDRDELPYTQVFPYRFVASTDEEARSYITMHFAYDANSIWKNGVITFYLFCHKTLVQTDYGVLRYDFMLQRLNELLHDTKFSQERKTWLGRLRFIDMQDVNIDDKGDYLGLMVRYTMVEEL